MTAIYSVRSWEDLDRIVSPDHCFKGAWSVKAESAHCLDEWVGVRGGVSSQNSAETRVSSEKGRIFCH